MKNMIKHLLALASLEVAIGAVAAPAGSISSSDIKGEWPLTVQPVRVLCQTPKYVILEAPDGKTYGVNGTSRMWREQGVRDIDEVWKVVNPAKGSRSANLIAVANLAEDKCRVSGQFK